jgi:hypothetical protein
LTILSADSLQPAEVGEAAARVRDLTQAMKCNRIRRIRACGFDAATAPHLGPLHAQPDVTATTIRRVPEQQTR